ncbi:MAG: class I SAM-dependent methyltransferase [Coriobacteriia bacterium]
MSDLPIVRGPLVPNPWHAVIAAVLRGIRAGTLDVAMPDRRTFHFAGSEPGPSARIEVHDAGIARRIVTGGDIAFARGYMSGAWDTPDLNAVLDLGLVNLSEGWAADLPVALRPFHRAWHAMRDNDAKGGSKRNIEYHYDLGNDFYELWLDETMTYSSACSVDGDGDLTSAQLECAQRRKWDRILEMIQPGSRDHVLEIGCGWGGFAIHAAREAGCRVTGLTLSEEQAALARRRVAEQGLDGQIDIRLQDYREVPGTYGAIASIEMFEAVGEKWWATFFGRVRELLEPGRAAGLQVITIAEERFEDYKRDPDFIQRYIFPGGMLPSFERFHDVAQAAGLGVGEPHFFGADYARTLSAWSQRFEGALPDIRALGFDERFVRMWRYYLAYCKTGFEHGTIDVMQVRLEA